MKKEKWNTVPGTDGKYLIDISTKEGRCINQNYRNTGKPRVFTSVPNKKDGRIRWTLTINGKPITQQAAYWIAITYPELVQNTWFPGAQIDHIDTDPLNNHPSNLRWVTPKENTNNPLTKKQVSALRKGRKLTAECKKKIAAALTNHPSVSKPVAQYTMDGIYIDKYPSAGEASRVTKINRAHISAVCEGKRAHAGPFSWSFI